MKDVVIVAAKRSAIGKFGGSLSGLSAVELGTQTLKGMLADFSGINTADSVIVGNVLASGEGQNIARQIALNSGLSQETPAFTLNQVCGSGMQSVILAVQAIRSGDADTAIAGGVESMSNAPFLLPQQRWGNKMGNAQVIDTMIQDGLWDAFNDYHMGITAENVAATYAVSREEQDSYAAGSQKKAAEAQSAGNFNEEIVSVEFSVKRQIQQFDKDEFIRPNTSVEDLSALKAVFKKEGTVTAGNASGLNDGAAFLLLMTAEKADQLGYKVLARVSASTTIGHDPSHMGYSPVLAVRRLLDKENLGVSDIDLFELNEAFAAQAVAVQRDLGISDEKVNVNGGAIALGHPIGASGARIIVTLVHEMKRRKSQKGVASLCIGGGQATAVLLEME